MSANGWRVVRFKGARGTQLVVYCPNHGPEGVA